MKTFHSINKISRKISFQEANIFKVKGTIQDVLYEKSKESIKLIKIIKMKKKQELNEEKKILPKQSMRRPSAVIREKIMNFHNFNQLSKDNFTISSKSQEDVEEEGDNDLNRELTGTIFSNIGFIGENLFYKEENNKANNNLNLIKSMKFLVFTFFIIIWLLNFIIFLLGPYILFPKLQKNSTLSFELRKFQNTYMQSYNLMLNFVFLNEGYFRNNFNNDSSFQKYKLKQTQIFEENYAYLSELNRKDSFHSFIRNYKDFQETITFFKKNLTINLDQTTNLILTHLHQINQIKKENLNKTNESLNFFRNYTFKSIRKIFYEIDGKLIKDMINEIEKLDFLVLILLFVEAALFIICLFILIKYIPKIFSSFETILRVFPSFDGQQIKKVKKYYSNLLESIAFREYDYETENKTARTTMFFNDTQNFLNQKKSKIIHSKGVFRKMKKNIYIYFILLIFFTSILNFGFLIQIRSKNTVFLKFLSDGDILINKIHFGIDLLSMVKEKIYSNQNYEKIYDLYIKKDIQLFLSIKNIPKFSSFQDANYYDYFSKLYFNNPCDLFNILTKEEIIECENLSIGILKQGISPYLNYFVSNVEDFLKNIMHSKFDFVGYKNIYEFDKAFYFINKFYLFAIVKWNSQFDDYLKTNFNLVIIFLAVIILLMIISYLKARSIVLSLLQRKFNYLTNVYNLNVPTYIVETERIIKAELKKKNILKN